MSIFSRFRRKKNIDSDEEWVEDIVKDLVDEEISSTPLFSEQGNISKQSEVKRESFVASEYIANNPSLRKQYVENCCGQIIEAENRITEIKQEYQLINSYMSDVQIVDNLNKQQKLQLENEAKRIIVFNNDREEFGREKGKLTVSQYNQIADNEEEIQEVIKRLQEDESYCQAVRTDMRYLEGEKFGINIESKDLKNRINSLGTLAKVSFMAILSLIFCIWLYNYTSGNDVTMLLYSVVVVAMILVLVIFILHQRTIQEIKYCDARMAKTISLLNKVKIKYVNVASRLEFMYEKYGVKSSNQMVKVWNAYVQEENKRKVYQRTSEKLLEAEQKLMSLLKSYGVKDQEVWINQVDAIIDKKAMHNLKKKLENRREKVKYTLDYNMDVMEKSKNEIKTFVTNNKKYAKEIMDIVDSYNI